MTETSPPERTGGDRRRPSWRLRLFNLYPPFRGAGIRVLRLAADPLVFATEMRLHWWNRNYVGTHYGGSLYSMCDPFFMLILIDALGPGYVVWDKAATIRFLRPGRGTVRARFAIAPRDIDAVRSAVARDGKVEPIFTAQVLDAEGAVVAEVEKRLYVRQADRSRPPSSPNPSSNDSPPGA